MDYRYRLKGKVTNNFILRGMAFDVGTDIDFPLTEKEIDFVKERCAVDKVIDLKEQPRKPIPTKISQNETIEEVKNEQQTTDRQYKRTSKKQVRVSN